MGADTSGAEVELRERGELGHRHKRGEGLRRLLEAVERLRGTEVRDRVEARMREFKALGAGSS
ncbi:hypothetical protein J7L60_02450, partial [Candidatus Bathyarchaeota archaeon]|nr:hypothetical protein [Candidatus Bathyarchaeota archaeon]